jgi:superfamily II DNA or RNA helicase
MSPCKKVKLENYQTAPAVWLADHPKQHGIALLFPTGHGKTLAAAACAIELMERDMISTVRVIAPKSLQSNLDSAYQQCDHALSQRLSKNTRVFTYQSIESDPTRLKDVDKRTLIVLDEAHKMRELDTNLYEKMKPICHRAGFVVVLTATPYANRTGDVANILGLINPSIKEYSAVQRQPTVAEIRTFSRNLVAFPDVDKSASFPAKIEIQEEVDLDSAQVSALNKYAANKSEEMRKKNAYYNKTRQLSISVPPYVSLKLKRLAANVKGNTPALVFSSFVNSSGVMFIQQSLQDLLPDLRIEVFTGALIGRQREALVQNVNNGKIDVLVLSDSGGEGLDFKGVRSVHLLHTEWNAAAADQKTGRAVRFESHSHLPPDQRTVRVFRYISVPRRTMWEFLTRKDKTLKCVQPGQVVEPECTEYHLFNIEKRKREEMKQTMAALLSSAIPVTKRGLEGASRRKNTKPRKRFVCETGDVFSKRKGESRWVPLNGRIRRRNIHV